MQEQFIHSDKRKTQYMWAGEWSIWWGAWKLLPCLLLFVTEPGGKVSGEGMGKRR